MDLVKAFSAAPKEAVFPKREYEDRLKQVRTVMLERGLDLLLMHNMPNICWLCGHQTPMADWYNCLIVPAQGELTLQICDVALGIVNSHTVTKFEFVRWYATLSDAAPQLIDLLGNYSIHGRRVGLEMRRPGLDPATFCELTRSFPRTEFVDATDVVLNLRAVKSPAEIERLRRAANMTDVAMHAAMAAIKPGATENTVAATAVDAMFRAGSEFLSIASLTVRRDHDSPRPPLLTLIAARQW